MADLVGVGRVEKQVEEQGIMGEQEWDAEGGYIWGPICQGRFGNQVGPRVSMIMVLFFRPQATKRGGSELMAAPCLPSCCS